LANQTRTPADPAARAELVRQVRRSRGGRPDHHRQSPSTSRSPSDDKTPVSGVLFSPPSLPFRWALLDVVWRAPRVK